MREILFRGKDIANNWHYGVPLVFTEDYVCITAPHTYNKAVIPETVGQYTGLRDCKRTKEYPEGQMIFEGDIVESTSDLVNLRGEKSGKKITKFYEIVVTADNSSFTYGTREIGETYISRTIYKENAQRFYSVIGNIHDNPELLKGE